MLIDLLPTFTRFNVERFPSSLVVLIPHGRVRGPAAPQQLTAGHGPALEPAYEGSPNGQHFLAFLIRPDGAPSYTDTDATGWDFSICISNQMGNSYLHVSLVQEGTRWVARLRDGRTTGSIDVTIPAYDPAVRDSLAFDEGLGTHIPDVWERLLAE
jgi:hypothetical protein